MGEREIRRFAPEARGRRDEFRPGPVYLENVSGVVPGLSRGCPGGCPGGCFDDSLRWLGVGETSCRQVPRVRRKRAGVVPVVVPAVVPAVVLMLILVNPC